jgi:hypothetical protein
VEEYVHGLRKLFGSGWYRQRKLPRLPSIPACRANHLGNEMGYVESTAQLSGSEASVSKLDADTATFWEPMLATNTAIVPQTPQSSDAHAVVKKAPEPRESSFVAMAIVAVVLFAVWAVFTVAQRLSGRRDRASARA